MLMFLLGHAGLLVPGYAVLAIVLSAAFLFFLLKRNLKEARPEVAVKDGWLAVEDGVLAVEDGVLAVNKAGVPAAKGVSRREAAFFVLTAVFALAVALLAMTPPSVRDELIHHLAVPRLYVQKGRIFEIPFMGFSYFPMNIDLLYIIPLLLGNDIFARLIHFAFAVLTGLVIYSYLRPRLGRAYAVLGFLLFFSTPVVMNLARTAYVDLGATFFSTLALVGILEWGDGGREGRKDGGKGEKRLFYWSALSMGLAIGAKYNMLISLFLLTFLVVHLSIRKGSAQRLAIRDGFIFFAIAITVFSPWLIRNYVWKGSPFYPMMQAAISKAATEGGGLHFGEALSPIGRRYLLYNESTLDIVLVPLRIFLEGVDNSIEKFDGVLNPFLLIFMALSLFRIQEERDIKYLVVFSVLFSYIALFTADLVIRYILPVFPPLVVMAVRGVRHGMEEKRGMRYASIAALVLLFSFNLFYLGGLYQRYMPLGYITGGESRSGYLSRVLPDYRVVEYANANIPLSSRVLFLFTGDRGYYWERGYFYGDRMGGDIISFVKRAGDAEGLKREFLDTGATHLFILDRLLEKFAGDNFNDNEIRLLSAFFKDSTERLYGANGFSLYRIRQ
ncbi:MAG: glycosyltransferase family 39 protein [Deltaproteobacteria bacterium]|nr:glycosyltransferase family 39 protein [Deltaproteobacteria bacterium]